MPIASRIDDFVAAAAPAKADLFADRREWKFLVGAVVAERLRAIVAARMPREEFVAGRPVTRVQSIYFDTPDLALYRRCSDPECPSLKFRVRAYAGPDGTGDGEAVGFLEYKAGVGVGEAKRRRKQRIRLSHERLHALVAPDSPMVDADKPRWAAAAGFVRAHGLMPRLTVTYRREAFVEPEADLRLTFDTGYQASAIAPSLASGLHAPTCGLPGYVIIEVKFLDRFPDWFASALEAEGIPAVSQSFSKFKTAVALLFPERA
ncbi:MAG: polyphosphate polymerase domain-containing protein [Candidatus Sericytochromatia bacterium]